MSVKIQELQHEIYGKCLELSNGAIELLVTVDFGPRIISLRTPGGKNMFGELDYDPKSTEYQITGGHRLWHSPEATPRSYEVDDAPVHWEVIDNGIRTVQNPEKWAMTQKQMEIVLEDEVPGVSVVHSVRNVGAWPVKLAAWGISVMSKGGLEVVPQPKRETGLLSNRVMALWPYTDMSDPRVGWGKKYITLRQDPNAETSFKFGINNEESWGAYFNHNQVFIKQHLHEEDAVYPDGGMSYETYTDVNVLEMESLSPLTELGPDEVIEHAEYWALIDDFPMPDTDEESLARAIGQLIAEEGEGCGCGHCGGDCDCEDGDCDCEGGEDCDCGHHHHH